MPPVARVARGVLSTLGMAAIIGVAGAIVFGIFWLFRRRSQQERGVDRDARSGRNY